MPGWFVWLVLVLFSCGTSTFPHPLGAGSAGRRGWGHTVGVLKNQAPELRLVSGLQHQTRSNKCPGCWGLRRCVGSGGVGLLFEIWIVDASIFCSVLCALPARIIERWREPGLHVSPFLGGLGGVFFSVVGGGVGLVVCVTSCEGHMVDALASRADEGRRSLR